MDLAAEKEFDYSGRSQRRLRNMLVGQKFGAASQR
jgi:hypothetical protein